VQNAVFEQKDPLLIYKFEAVNLFQRFVARVNMDTISFVIKAEIPEVQSTNQSQKPSKEKAPKLQLSKDEAISSLVGGLASGSEGGSDMDYHDPSQRSVERVAPRQAIKIADRNQRVTVQYMDGSTKENVKYKVVEQDVESGKAVVIA
jgi:preprotein translocase subunit SecA